MTAMMLGACLPSKGVMARFMDSKPCPLMVRNVLPSSETPVITQISSLLNLSLDAVMVVAFANDA